MRRNSAARRRGALGLLFVLGAIVAVGVSAIATSGAEYSATATVSPHATYLDDAAGSTFTFTVTNTGTVASIGAVEIRRPDGSWTVLSCNGQPSGWSGQRADPMCRFRSAAGAGDDIAPGDSATFSVRIATAPGAADRPGTFAVTVSKTNQFDNPSQLTAALAAPGDLVITAHTFQILDAVIATGLATPGSACPAASKSGNVDATVTVVICGKNRSTGAQTPTAGFSSLGGTLLQSSGTFSSGSIAANSASSVVLGNWSGAQIRTLGGTNLTVVAVIGADATHSSPSTTLSGYTALNTDPVAADDAYSVNEDDTLTVVAADGVLANDTDANGHSLTAALDDDVDHGTLTFASDGSFTYDPTDEYEGEDTFTYTVSDGHGGSDGATVTITVDGVNDPPTAINQQYSTAVPNTKFAVGRPSEGAPVVHASGNLTDGATDLDSSPLGAVAETVTTSGGGSATIFADGTFTYVSEAGETADTDTFSYRIDDGEGATSAPATVTINLNNDMIWYVDDSAAAGGDGRSTSPFQTLSPLQGAGDPDGVGDTIFLSSGTYGVGLPLESGQELIGQPAGLTDSTGSIAIVPAGTGTRPLITNAPGNGVTLANDNTITSIAVTAADTNGIYGSGITKATLIDLRLGGNGTNATTPGSGIRLDDPHGAISITDTVVNTSRVDNLRVTTLTGAVTLEVVDSSFDGTAGLAGAHGVRFSASGSSTATASFLGVTFDGNKIAGLQAVTTGSATLGLTVRDSTFDSNFIGFEAQHAGSGSLSATVRDNTFSSTLASSGAPLNLFLSAAAGSGASSILGVTVQDNTISNNGSASAPGIWYHTGASAGHARVAITGNTISNVGQRGISLETGPGSNTLDASVTGNTVTVSAGGAEAIFVQSGVLSADTVAVCANIGGNSASSPDNDIRVRQRFLGTTLRLPGYAGAGTDDGAVQAFLLGQNTGTDALATHQSVAGFGGGGACLAP